MNFLREEYIYCQFPSSIFDGRFTAATSLWAYESSAFIIPPVAHRRRRTVAASAYSFGTARTGARVRRLPRVSERDTSATRDSCYLRRRAMHANPNWRPLFADRFTQASIIPEWLGQLRMMPVGRIRGTVCVGPCRIGCCPFPSPTPISD